MKEGLKKIYYLVPFKKQLFLLLKYFWVPPHNVYKHLHFTGTIKVKVDEEVSFNIIHFGTEIENDIFWKGLTGGWEKISMKLWMQLCRKAKVILDICANTGIYALTAKAVKPESSVFAFEPLHRMCDKLKRNVRINDFDIDCIEKAVSDKSGKAIIYENDTEHIAAASLNPEVRANGPIDKETEVETITIDDFIDSNNLSQVDLIKIDVETYEPQVIEGFKKDIALFRPTLLIEILMDEVGEKIQQMFEGLDYLYFDIDDRNGKISLVKKIQKSKHFNYLICTEQIAKELKLIS
jgi:FkbM family methyltransferase